MDDQRHNHEDLLAYAQSRCPEWLGGIGVAYVADATERGRDEARRWTFLLVNTAGAWAYVDFVATRIGYSQAFVTEPLEVAVENFVSYRYEPEHRLAELIAEAEQAEDPLHLPLDDRHRVPASVS